ncbi:MAG: RNA polymerase sigma factor [Planctomycetota bacterium]
MPEETEDKHNAAGPQLIANALRGDEEACTALVELYSGRLLAFLQNRGVGRTDALDQIQDTWIRAFRSLHRYRSTYAFSTWLFTIGRRVSIDWHRRHKPVVPLEAIPEPTGGETGAPELPNESSLWDLARERLDERSFEALWLRYHEDLKPGAIAEILGMGKLHARVLLHRARQRLAAIPGLEDR